MIAVFYLRKGKIRMERKRESDEETILNVNGICLDGGVLVMFLFYFFFSFQYFPGFLNANALP